MVDEQFDRRLAAILAADVVGYSRLMESNEERTLGELRKHRREFFDPVILRNGGRIFKEMGDGFLVEFNSVLNATRCAVEIQTGMPERNAGVPDDRHIQFRIGINMGDIIVDGDDFQGDGVNMAVRLEGLAIPGGIACSAAVQNQVVNKLDREFLDQGEKTVKNITQPVHVYFVNLGPPMQRGSLVAADAAQPALPDKPSIAVLPFENMSSDPEQEFFSDGITEDIIIDLSNVSGLFVLGRNTVFSHKGKVVDLVSVAKQLGVAYVVQGSVRKAGNRVRINAQLIEGATGGHVWADRFDRDLTDIFAVQDEITRMIVDQLKVKLLPEEKEAIAQAPTANVEAYSHYLRGREYYHISSKANLLMARQSFTRAVELDPTYARAYASMAVCESRLMSQFGVTISAGDILKTADKALAIDPDLAEAHAARGVALAVGDNRVEASPAFKRAIDLDPNSNEAHRFLAEFCVTDSNFEAAATHFIRALETKPDDCNSALMLVNVLRSLEREEEAKEYGWLGIKRAEKELKMHPENGNIACLGATVLAYLGEQERAIEWLSRALKINPDDDNTQYNAACTYSLLGEHDKSIDLLETWLSRVGSEMKLWFKNDSDLMPIRDHPRYRRLLELAE